MIRDTREQGIVDDLSQRHGVSQGVIEHLTMALIAGHTNQAQFNHSELGGMGQWSSGGMIMVGDMFNNGLKHRVDMLCSEIADCIRSGKLSGPKSDRPYQSQSQGNGSSFFYQSSSHSSSWPQHLGQASSTGAQNNLRYAFFPVTRRLAIDVNGEITVYDTKDHNIGGFSQQQSGDQSLTFTSQHGLVRVADLDIVTAAGSPETPLDTQGAMPNLMEAAPIPSVTPPSTNLVSEPTAFHQDDIISKIERLAGLRSKGIISDEEFAAKKTELLERL
ncbi:SHOCT domain-containing protein [Agrobacterium rosae]|uniref:SHOCT domain-containing protein n=1 Tax=Agrobacterium rosae TaxID=1972867 RepID=A0AAW9FLR6_9HYPH|nr:SHOCT domain-containing protein [Agrobacterium rosae]MDX8305378.1 SHOCT domain-containing protein [Agrobacterium rosae]